MIKSKCVYSAQNYVACVTGEYYILKRENTTEEIESILVDYGYCDLWNYPLDEIAHILENNIDVVLVDVSSHNNECEWNSELRWFEVPPDFDVD